MGGAGYAPAAVAKGEYTMLEAAGREVRLSNPAKVYFPKPGWTKLDLAHVLPRARRRRARPRARAPDGDEALRQRDHGGADLAEARAEERPRLAADGDGRVPVRAHRRGARRQRRRAPRVGGQPRRDRLQPVAGAARRPRPSRRAARRPRPDARHRLGRRAPHRDGRPRRARRARAARLPEDVGLQGHPRQRPDRAASGTSSRCAARRSRWRARSSGARPTSRRASGGRRSATACSSTTTRTRATAPSPPATPSARRPTRACRARWSGTRCPTSSPATCGSTRCPARARDAATRRPTSTRTPGSLDALLDLARRDEEGGLGDAPWPPHFPKQKGEPKRVQPSRDRDRPTQRGRAGDPQPGGPPPGVRTGGLQRGFGSKPRTGQGHEHEFDDD